MIVTRSGRCASEFRRRLVLSLRDALLVGGFLWIGTSQAFGQPSGGDAASGENSSTQEVDSVNTQRADSVLSRGGQQSRESETLSPLHSFLGIDPDTGEFLPEPNRNAAEALGEQDGMPSAEETVDSGSRPLTSDDAAATVQQFLEHLDEGSVAGLDQLLAGGTAGGHLFALRKQVTLILGGLLLIYPLGIVCSELLAWSARRDAEGLSELDRRYERTRFRRRLTYAGLLTLLICGMTLGQLNAFWWNQPVWLTTFCALVIVAGLWTVALAGLIKQSAKGYSVAIMRDVRRNQLELRQDLDEIRRRLNRLRTQEAR